MATKDDATKSEGCTFQWKIENIHHSWWMNQDQEIESPKFIADAVLGTKWSLRLCLMDGHDEGFVGIYLHRETDCCGKEIIGINYEIAILDKNGSFLKVKNLKDVFLIADTWGFAEFATRNEVFATKRQSFLPQETLTVQCTLWNKEGKSINPKHLYARTAFNANHRLFVWRIEDFSAAEPGLRKKLRNSLFDLDFVLNKDCGKKLDIDLISWHDNLKYISVNISIIDSIDIKENWGNKEYFIADLKKGIVSPAFVFPEKLIKNKVLYLPSDVLSLEIDFIYWTIAQFGYNDELGNLSSKGVESSDGKEKTEKTVDLINDLKSMFCDAILSDTELRISTKSFPAHKSILSARSLVFRKMFCNDMKERNSGHVSITDFEEDTVHRMLLYIYTDSLEDLQFESALKLYAAADKYKILSLRNKCSTFLKDGLCPKRACDVLILADLHHDDDLKSAVQSYILEHDEVFRLSEWKDLMVNNLKLAADIMFKKLVFPFNA